MEAHRRLHQLDQIASLRAADRTTIRDLLRKSGNERQQQAVRMAENGYGVDDIRARTGVELTIAKALVIGRVT